MEKVYLQVNFPNIITIGFIVFIIYTFGGAVIAAAKRIGGQVAV